MTGTSYPPRRDRPVLNLLGVIVGLVASAAAGFYFWTTAGRVSLEVRGAEIVNAAQLLEDAEQLMAATAAGNGATVNDDARCHFAPSNNDLPAVLCGPIWLGMSPVDQPWLEVQSSYRVDGDQATGTLDGFAGTTAADPGTFARPDDVSAATPGTPARPSAVPRRRSGSVLVDPAAMVAAAEAELESVLAAEEQNGSMPLAVVDDWRCYLVQGPDQVWDLSLIHI